MFRYLPEQASSVAAEVDWLNNLITDLSVFFTVAIVGAMLYFAFRYRKRDGVDHATPRIEGSTVLEIIWTVVPTIVCIYIAAYGLIVFHDLRKVPDNALQINVTAQKWKWDFEYPNGKKTVGTITIPVDKPVKLLMTSRDVNHGFFVPAMRVKSDVVPKQYTYVTFTPIKTGKYVTFCSHYCGTSHSNMMADINVVSSSEYDRWVNDRSEENRRALLKPEDLGKVLYVEKGCNACHSLDGVNGIGPSWLKIWGREGEYTDDAEAGGYKHYKVDENYIIESILYPAKHKVKGFENGVMPSYDGQLSSDEISYIIAFMKNLNEPIKIEAAPPPVDDDLASLTPVERGKLYYQKIIQPTCSSCHSLDGSNLAGPTWKGLFGSQVKLVDGSSVKADEEYIKSSIQNPGAQIVEGYTNSMPPLYKDMLKDEQIADIIEFMKTIK